MKMKVSQWALLIETMKDARDRARRKYQYMAGKDSIDDYAKSEAWRKFDELCGIINILEATEI